MPELPEVETVRRGIEPYVSGKRVRRAIVRQRKLRFPVSRGLEKKIRGAVITDLSRRGKYLLLGTDSGHLIIHLGMSGCLRVLKTPPAANRHDHFDLLFDDGWTLRFHDPRRFGCVLWTSDNPLKHKLLRCIGPEPFDKAFNGSYLYAQSRKRKAAVKNFIMDSKVVAGVGNIYANEALHIAGIRPGIGVGRLSAKRLDRLAAAIRRVLRQAIKDGGTSLRDFIREDGQPGYFKTSLKVYDRAGLPCLRCGENIALRVIGQRASYYCPHCQR